MLHMCPHGHAWDRCKGDTIGDTREGIGMGRREKVAEYVAKRVERTVDGCWNWLLSTNEHGYGVCSRRDWRGYAHRFTYTHFVGPIPDGLYIDHLCRNTSCVNPEHLEPVTNGENQRRANRSLKNRNYTLCQLADGRWLTSVEVGTPGHRKRKTWRALSRDKVIAQAEAWVAEHGLPSV